MSREVQVFTWCDVCVAPTPGQTVTVALDYQAPLEVDLCADHREELVEPLMSLLAEHGSKPQNGPATPVRPNAAIKGQRRGLPPTHERSMVCLWCGAGFASASGLARHTHLVHGFTPKLAATYGRQCPMCGEVAQMLGQHARARHQTNTAALFIDALKAGDKHKVVGKIYKSCKVPGSMLLTLEELKQVA